MSYQLFKVGNVWHYRFQLDGKRLQRTTGETLHHRAAAVADDAYREARLWSAGYGPVPTLRELAQQWLTAHRPTVSAAHLKVVSTTSRLHLYDLCDVPIAELTTALVEDGRNRHLRTHAPASANTWLRTIRLLCNWAVRRGVIPKVPFSVRMLKIQKRPRTILPTALASAWLASVDLHARDRLGIRTAVRLMLGMGLRENETITARWEWLDIERRTFTPGKTKGREATPLPIPLWLLEYLTPLRQRSGFMVTRPDGHVYRHGFTRQVMLNANREVGAGHITAHRLRGTFATLLSESGTPVQDIQRVMRHRSIVTTTAYLETDIARVAAAQEHIAGRFGFNSPANLDGERVASKTEQSLGT